MKSIEGLGQIFVNWHLFSGRPMRWYVSVFLASDKTLGKALVAIRWVLLLVYWIPVYHYAL